MHFSSQPLRPLLLLALLLLSAGNHLFAQAPPWQDATSPGLGFGQSTAVDVAGNTYVTGQFTGTATFGATTLTSVGSEDVFVAKRTPAGAWEWATRAGGSSFDYSNGVAVDSSGSVVVTGNFGSPTITFGAITLTNTSAGSYDIFVAKLTSAGAWQWATRAGGNNFDEGSSVSMDDSGSAVITGDFNSPTITFGATTLTNVNAGLKDLFVAKLTWQWATSVGGSNDDVCYGVALDNSGSVVVTGNFNSPTIPFGITTITSAGSNDLFVAKLTSTGAWQWATGAGGSSLDYSNGVAVDGSGNVVITGHFVSPTITFGASTLTSTGISDLFVAKLTPMGAWQWATSAGGSADDYSFGVAVDGSSVVVAGAFTSPTISFGATTLVNPSSAGDNAIFLARLSSVTGLPEAAGAPRLTLAPNPARTTVQLSGAPTGAATVYLLDALGREVRTAPLSPAGAAILDVRGLPAGVYGLRAGAATQRLMVE